MSKNQTLQHKRSSVPGNRPTAAQVATGELAINFADRSIYTKDASNNIIELARDIVKSATAPTLPANGDLWWDTVNSQLKFWDGTTWANILYSGPTPLPANTTTPAGTTGSGTLASPYIVSFNVIPGATVIVGTFTVTGLAAKQFVPIFDMAAVTNGSRFEVTNNIANDAGTLVFSLIYTDDPASTIGTVRTAQLRVGTATVYINGVGTTVSPIPPFPQSLNAPVNTLATTTPWSSPSDTLTSTGDLLISSDGVTYGQGPLSINNGGTLYLRWSGAAGSGTGIDGAHGTTITGTVVTSAGSVSTSSLTIDKQPAAYTFTAQTGVASSALVQSNTVTLSGVNSYVYLTSANTMTASVAGGTYTSVPASGTSLFALNGQTLVVQQTSSSSPNTTTTVTISAGGVTSAFAVTTGNNIVNTPSITTPISGATGISPTATIVASAYSVSGIVGAHLNSDWEIYSDAGLTTLVTSSMASTTNLTTWTPSGLAFLTQYWARVRYRSNDSTPIVSSWSPSGNWTTGPLIISLLIIGGGGGGGSNYRSEGSGGGGAGGFLEESSITVSPGSYPIIIGSGGAVGGSGGQTSISLSPTYASQGGGAGFGIGGGVGVSNFGLNTATLGASNDGAGGPDSGWGAGYGGGGAGGDGTSNGYAPGGTGGAGRASTIAGPSTLYAGGGGGGNGGAGGDGGDGGPGGTGGGGRGGQTPGSNNGSTSLPSTAGDANSGGGGGGSSGEAVQTGGIWHAGSTGGSGVVIIAYPGTVAYATGGSISTTSRPGWVVHTFTTSGTFTVS